MSKKDDNIKMKPNSTTTTLLRSLARFKLVGVFLTAVALTAIFLTLGGGNKPLLFCLPARSVDPAAAKIAEDYSTTPSQLLAILHYATSKDVPQQSNDEVRVTFDVLKTLSPCNFLVFGLGRDSLMWATLNPRGTTLFLEEDPEWIKSVVAKSPILKAKAVQYRTHLSQADELIAAYKSEPDCAPSAKPLSPDSRCPLALTELPGEVFKTEWDLIMVDAPRGYYAAAPGRMAAIYSAAVMARARRGPGVTHVFLHDVNRRVERMYAEEFLCEKYRVKEVGRLWHFVIPPAANVSRRAAGKGFCSD